MKTQEGDLVRCRVDRYMSVGRGGIREVLSTNPADNTIVLPNKFSPVGYSSYRAENFSLYKQKLKEHSMLHIAVQVKESQTYEELAGVINREDKSYLAARADTSASALKEWVRQRIQANPDERWLILSGNTIGETACPPVRFRSV